MKRVLFMLALLIGSTALQAQSITVASDRNLDTDFGQYKTFDFASQVDNELDEGMFFLNDLVLKSQVREAVRGELLGLGYEQQESGADLIVNFRVFDQETRIRGTEGYGTSYWGTDSYRSISDTTSYEVEPGTLMISLVDREDGTIVWHGFASGLIDNDAFVKDEGRVREAVSLIFDEYGMRAREYSKR